MKIGVDVGGSHIAIGVVNSSGIIVEKIEKILTNIEKENIKDTIENYIVTNFMLFSKKYSIDSIGIAIPGTIHDGVILSTVNLGLENYNIVKNIQDKIDDVPITLGNDAKCAAIAEKEYGCLKGYGRSVFLTLGTGIGGAAFLDGKLLKAGIRPGYEFGHMVIQKNGIECNCGRKGCFERYASMKVFKNKLRKVLQLDETVTGKDLLKIISDNNKESTDYVLIESVISEFIEDLSIGIGNLINIFEPELIGIGGSFVYFREIFLDRLKYRVGEDNLKRIGRQEPIIDTAKLGNDAGMIGATLLSVL